MSSMIIRRNQLKQVVGISPSTVDRLEAAGNFPKRRKWSTGIVGWLGTEVQAWATETGETIR